MTGSEWGQQIKTFIVLKEESPFCKTSLVLVLDLQSMTRQFFFKHKHIGSIINDTARRNFKDILISMSIFELAINGLLICNPFYLCFQSNNPYSRLYNWFICRLVFTLKSWSTTSDLVSATLSWLFQTYSNHYPMPALNSCIPNSYKQLTYPSPNLTHGWFVWSWWC